MKYENIKQCYLREDMYNHIPKDGVGVELGVARGLNAINLFHITRPKKLHLVDRWTSEQPAIGSLGGPVNHPVNKKHRESFDNYGEHVSSLFSKQVEEGSVELHRTDSRLWLTKQPKNSLDWVYLDTNHDYNSTRNEIQDCLAPLKHGGLLCGHDFHINRFWGLGVVAPLIEAIQEGSLVLEALSSDDWPSYICRVIKDQ